MNTICINCYPKFKEVEGIRTSTLVYVNTLQGSEEEIAKYVAKKAEEGYPVQYDDVSNLPLVWLASTQEETAMLVSIKTASSILRMMRSYFCWKMN